MIGRRGCFWAVFLLLAGTVSSAEAQVRAIRDPISGVLERVVPATQPGSITETRLENPRNAGAKAFVDLDTGKTFTYGESSPNDHIQSRRWLRESGADLMCETRYPAHGFSTYDLVLVPTKGTIEDLTDYNVVANQVRVDPEPFELITVGAALPRTYVFKTREGAIGVLEISSFADELQGLNIRSKILQRPPTARPLPSRFVRINGPILNRPPYRGMVPYTQPLAGQVEAQRDLVVQLKRQHGDGDIRVFTAIQELEQLERELKAETTYNSIGRHFSPNASIQLLPDTATDPRLEKPVLPTTLPAATSPFRLR